MDVKDICHVFSGERGREIRLVRGTKEVSVISVTFYVIIIIKIKT